MDATTGGLSEFTYCDANGYNAVIMLLLNSLYNGEVTRSMKTRTSKALLHSLRDVKAAGLALTLMLVTNFSDVF